MPQEPKSTKTCADERTYTVMRYRQRDEITGWIPDSDSVRQF